MLEDMSLKTLHNTKAGEQFDEAIRTVRESFEKDGDVDGARSVTLKLDFIMKDAFLFVNMKSSVATPSRSVKSICSMDEKGIKVDVDSGDVRQPMLNGLDNKKVAEKKIGD